MNAIEYTNLKEKAVIDSHKTYLILGSDPVEHPQHYTFGKYEVIDVLAEWFPSDPLLWQVGKYIARAKHKGKELEDLKKAQFYLTRKIKQMEVANAVQNPVS